MQVTTGDLGTRDAVVDALAAAGLPPTAADADLMPPSLLHMNRGHLLVESYLMLYVGRADIPRETSRGGAAAGNVP